jgi:hypothetical protein
LPRLKYKSVILLEIPKTGGPQLEDVTVILMMHGVQYAYKSPKSSILILSLRISKTQTT